MTFCLKEPGILQSSLLCAKVEKPMDLTEILKETTTKLCHGVTWVDKHERVGDIGYIRVSLNSLFINCTRRFIRK